MTYEQVKEAMPTRLWDRLHEAIKHQFPETYEDKILSLQGKKNEYYSVHSHGFGDIGEFINYSITWSGTKEGRSYWEQLRNFYTPHFVIA